MKNEHLIIGILFCFLAERALADDDVSFDVLQGRVHTLFSGELAPSNLISCKFSVSDVLFGPDWKPSVSIIFSPANKSKDTKPAVRLTAFRSEENRGWRHELTISNNDDRESVITAHVGRSDSVLPMNLLWNGDKYVVFYVGDDVENMSMVDASQHALVNWEVVASGVKGVADCSCFQLGQKQSE